MNRAMYRDDLRRALEAAPDLSPLSGKSILITGASGLLGSTLVDLLMLANAALRANVRITALARREGVLRERFAAYAGDPLLDCVAKDAADASPLGHDFVVHAASPAHPLAFSTDPVGTMKANLLGTLNLLEGLHTAGRGRLLLVSSGEIYGEGAGNFREGDCGRVDSMNPRSCYGESKRAAETLCASYHRQYGIDCVVARPCHCFGPAITQENSRADAQFLRNALRGEDIVMKSAGSQVRSYLYAPDAASGLLAVLLRGASGEAYNLAAGGGGLSIRAFAELIAGAAGTKVRFELPSDAERAGYSQITAATLNADKLVGLGFRARFSPEEGVARMVMAMRGGTIDREDESR